VKNPFFENLLKTCFKTKLFLNSALENDREIHEKKRDDKTQKQTNSANKTKEVLSLTFYVD